VESNRDLVMRFMAGTASGDLDSITELVHEDFVMEWPQSGERFVGRDNAFGAMRAEEQPPQMAAEPRLVGSGDVWGVDGPAALRP
jgi:ketosteroid isomerase-like protein